MTPRGEKYHKEYKVTNSLSLLIDDILMLIRKRNNSFPIRRRFYEFVERNKRSYNFFSCRQFYKIAERKERSVNFLSHSRFCLFAKQKRKDNLLICSRFCKSLQKLLAFQPADDILIPIRKQSITANDFFGLLAKKCEWNTCGHSKKLEHSVVG